MARSEEIVRERYKLMAPRIIKALNQRNFEAYFCETAKEAVEFALSLIPQGASVAWGGSMTLEEIGMIEQLKKGNYQVIDRDAAKSQEERFSLMRQALLSDVYLSSVNAISEDGIMVNIDGRGNRVSAIVFGPKTVILVVGMNKVCRDLESARKRHIPMQPQIMHCVWDWSFPVPKQVVVVTAIEIIREVFVLRLWKCTAVLMRAGLK